MAFADLHSQALFAISSIFRDYYSVPRQGSTLLPGVAAPRSSFHSRTSYEESEIHAI